MQAQDFENIHAVEKDLWASVEAGNFLMEDLAKTVSDMRAQLENNQDVVRAATVLLVKLDVETGSAYSKEREALKEALRKAGCSYL